MTYRKSCIPKPKFSKKPIPYNNNMETIMTSPTKYDSNTKLEGGRITYIPDSPSTAKYGYENEKGNNSFGNTLQMPPFVAFSIPPMSHIVKPIAHNPAITPMNNIVKPMTNPPNDQNIFIPRPQPIQFQNIPGIRNNGNQINQYPFCPLMEMSKLFYNNKGSSQHELNDNNENNNGN